MAKNHTVTHYRKECIGCGSCVMMAPQTWSMSEEDGLAVLQGSTQKGEMCVGTILDVDLADNQMAAEVCPVKAIRID